MTGVRRGWFHLASGAGVGRVFGFGSNLLLSRWLGPSELGLFNLVTTTVQTSEILVRCGGDYALNYELGGHPDAVQDERRLQLPLGLAQLCSLATTFICVGIAIWVWFGQGLFPVSLMVAQRLKLTLLLVLMIACEGISASAWEVLLVTHRTVPLALRQGLFFPLRLLLAAVGSLFGGVLGAMCGWSLTAVVQCIWLRHVLGHLWKPLQVWPLYGQSLIKLLRRGFPFYVCNLLASIIFYPLLLKVAAGSGLEEIGYLRAGQILQQLFAFLPATLVPVLFLRLRLESSFAHQVSVIERPLRIIWLLLVEVLLLYCMVDQSLIIWLFGTSFMSALLPTRILLITALFECLTQLLVQPVLATGQIRLYGFWQNAAALLAALVGWLLIPTAGLAAYITVRLLYVIIPLIAFGTPVLKQLKSPRKILYLASLSVILTASFLIRIFSNHAIPYMSTYFLILFLTTAFLYRQDLRYLQQQLMS